MWRWSKLRSFEKNSWEPRVYAFLGKFLPPAQSTLATGLVSKPCQLQASTKQHDVRPVGGVRDGLKRFDECTDCAYRYRWWGVGSFQR